MPIQEAGVIVGALATMSQQQLHCLLMHHPCNLCHQITDLICCLTISSISGLTICHSQLYDIFHFFLTARFKTMKADLGSEA